MYIYFQLHSMQNILPVLWISKPNITACDGSCNYKTFPDPNREEDNPVAPAHSVVKAQGEQQREY